MDIWHPGKPRRGSAATSSGNVCVLGIIDAFSKFLILVPLSNETSNEVIKALFERAFLPYGVPVELIFDGATNFNSTLTSMFLQYFGVTQRVTTPYRPQSNGQIERAFRSVRPAVAILAQTTSFEWDQQVEWVAYAHNTSFHRAINSTPFQLMFGRPPSLPPQELQGDLPPEQEERQRRWEEIKQGAEKALADEHQRQKDYYDEARARPQKMVVGDHVLIRMPRPPPNVSAKLAPRFMGPYEITKIFGPVLQLRPIYGKANFREERRIHKDRCILCPSDFPNIYSEAQLKMPFGYDPLHGLEEEAPE
jgi:hypothetical protein